MVGSTLHVVANDQLRGFVSAGSWICEQYIVAFDWGLGKVAERGGAPAFEKVFADLGFHLESEPDWSE